MKCQWITHPTILEGSVIDLIPLERKHLEELYTAAADKDLWALIPTDCSDKETFYKTYEFALSEREAGNQYPFVIRHKQTNKLIGSTRLFEIYPSDKKLEIGWTWITKDYWGTTINLECKLLLLTYCFEALKTNRVQLKTKDTNFRSRKAIEKIGGTFEGILRKDKVLRDGTTRNAAYYSILDDEWNNARIKILEQIKEKTKS
ncbi:GNAT family acetyltransferase [Elizabethkingia meningoseptica]|uniref:GNAT family N-acetyltransferase n=1 Tax=Elizabethkingia meningoseptica TaxID=238 RepID=UPI000332C446|nr:GNAT family N-acetyltransferase [Elizabethkingia meningoseptica]AQX03734.1 GNAT family acetyltransferase [Elizabethkingia meningoseptica]AQX45773.1 GNAT family acetyltransferase [Elizabethkingia meningoseptica]EOR29815.1 acetyltransferase, ribosomal protein N-acetylase [Elizabethkingia meningoseptica ATCC 13253 = NBRC 12535]KUY15066.1 GNAT family acetyltransferase [Elizabethkingia meningoseptica]OPB69563.1 GNAT family acetyltransferase [Elizabethkingia meningoseptica]